MSRTWHGAQQLEALLVGVDELTEDPQNARAHPLRNMEVIKGSLTDFGQVRAILTSSDGTVIAGNGTLRAVRELGWTHIAAVRFEGTPREARQYAIIDNNSALLAEWDKEGFAATLEALREEDPEFSVASLGFSDDEVRKILGPSDYEKREDEDDAPPLPEVAVSKLGEIWTVNGHRIGCGDSTDAVFVALVLGNRKPNLMCVDAPYGVEYDASWRNKLLEPANRAAGAVSNDHLLDWTAAYKLFPGNIAYTWFAAQWSGLAQWSLEDCGFEMRAMIVWRKFRPVISRGHYNWAHESAFYAVRKGKKSNWRGDNSQSTVWDVEHIKSDTGHSTQKPVELFRRPILNHTVEGEYVYDCFLGSSSSIAACEATNRIGIGCEIEPRYVDVSLIRLQNLTGKPAIRESDGKTFDELRGAQ